MVRMASLRETDAEFARFVKAEVKREMDAEIGQGRVVVAAGFVHELPVWPRE